MTTQNVPVFLVYRARAGGARVLCTSRDPVEVEGMRCVRGPYVPRYARNLIYLISS